MNEDDLILLQEFDDEFLDETRANLLVRLERLLKYESDDCSSLAFERNFRDCQKLYEQLKEATE